MSKNRNYKARRRPLNWQPRRTSKLAHGQLTFERLEPRQLLATFTVTSNMDAGSGSLRDAITQSNNAVGADTITFDSSVFTGGDNSLIRLTSGELEITDTLTIDGSTGVEVTITGDANDDDITDAANITDVAASFGRTAGAADDLLDDNSRVLNYSSTTGDLTLDDLTVTGGRTTADGGFVNTTSIGGGIRFVSGGVLSITNSVVGGNSTTGRYARGGGIGTFLSTVELTGSVVSGNSTADLAASGGGIDADRLTVVDSKVIGNSTTGNNADGGGIRARYLTMTDSEVIGNSVSHDWGNGGGIRTGYGSATLTRTLVAGNSSTGSGGGVANFPGPVSFIDSVFSGNSTMWTGGGIYGTSITLTNSTVYNNEARAVGGVHVVSTEPVWIENSILAGNSDDDIGPDFLTSEEVVVTINHSLIGDTTGSGISAASGIGNVLDQPALLGPLADNGGPTQSHALLPGSPAIDAGDPVFDLNGLDGLLGTEDDVLFDQRGIGFDRVLGGRVDMGAFEVGETPIAAPRVVLNKYDEGGVLARPDSWETLSVTFDSDVSITADALALTNDTLGGVAVDVSQAIFEYDASTFTASWTFDPTNPLPAAFYAFTLDASLIAANGFQLDGNRDGTGGDDLVAEHYVALAGDANLDGKVDVLGDAFTLVGNLGMSFGAQWTDGDFNGDGNVVVLGDAFLLVGQLGQSVIPVSAAASALSASAGLETNSVIMPPSGPIEPAPAGFTIAVVEDEAEDDDRYTSTRREVEAAVSPQLAGDQSRDLAFESEISSFDSLWF